MVFNESRSDKTDGNRVVTVTRWLLFQRDILAEALPRANARVVLSLFVALPLVRFYERLLRSSYVRNVNRLIAVPVPLRRSRRNDGRNSAGPEERRDCIGLRSNIRVLLQPRYLKQGAQQGFLSSHPSPRARTNGANEAPAAPSKRTALH